MPKYRVTGPDGQTYDVTAPEGASEQEVMDYVRSQAQSVSTGPQGLGAQESGPMTLQERSKEVFGFDDLAKRGTILPLGKTQGGETVFAWPQVLKDMAESALLPGHVMKGGTYEPEDVTRFALDYAVPFTSRRMAAPTRATRKGLIKSAPTSGELLEKGGKMAEKARASGVVLKPDTFADFAADLEKAVIKEGVAPKLHDKVISIMDLISKKVGKDLDIGELMTMRRQMAVAARGATPELADERRIASAMIEKLDDFVDNLADSELLAGAGNQSLAARQLRQMRTLWSRGRKSQIIEDAVENARTQASGFENGLRRQFDQIIKNKKLRRAFTKSELKIMKEVASGTPSRNALRLIGTLSYGTRGARNFLGGSVGSAGGAAVGSVLGGPPGAAIGTFVPPVIGYAAQRGAARATENAADLARAMAATGAPMPSRNPMITRGLLLGLGPVAGAGLLGEEPRRRLLMQPGA